MSRLYKPSNPPESIDTSTARAHTNTFTRHDNDIRGKHPVDATHAHGVSFPPTRSSSTRSSEPRHDTRPWNIAHQHNGSHHHDTVVRLTPNVVVGLAEDVGGVDEFLDEHPCDADHLKTTRSINGEVKGTTNKHGHGRESNTCRKTSEEACGTVRQRCLLC